MTLQTTDVLYYNYDFGDDWMIRITASMDACDLVEQGRVTQQDLDEAIADIYKNYRPVCIAADGMFLVDDAGGLSGYTRFLRSINPIAEKEYWGKDRPHKCEENAVEAGELLITLVPLRDDRTISG